MTKEGNDQVDLPRMIALSCPSPMYLPILGKLDV